MNVGRPLAASLASLILGVWVWQFLPAGAFPKTIFDDRWSKLPTNQSELSALLDSEYQFLCFFSAYALGPATKDQDPLYYREFLNNPADGDLLAKTITDKFSDQFPIAEGPALLMLFGKERQLMSAYQIHQNRGYLSWTVRSHPPEFQEFCASRERVAPFTESGQNSVTLKFQEIGSN